ncbi:hypothetical protein N657DRAFT_639354 [Parathielavia appendiculata]|uniref:Uncharacterized protein n=1 Tax=Parathielavia appendiculata TaxID=2587402 RepID=A0AAN6U9F0_9PEZI|nr:hypothetical protein N657DRAFT_639354 [Parathielavia appendiculata]
MSSLSASNCPKDSIPANLAIPENITYAVIPGQNASDSWIADCCDPYPVQLVESCWLWCQISPGVGINSNASDDTLKHEFRSCLRVNDRDPNISSSIMFHSSAPNSQRASLLRVVLASLATVSIMRGISAA